MDNTAQLADGKYQTYAKEGYATNELVYACIEELATSAAEPTLQAKVGGKWTHVHPVVTLLNAPNPFMSHFEFWATVILHRALAGNAYALIVRSASGAAKQLWLMRPDRVAVIPSEAEYIAGYQYDVGDGKPVIIPTRDVIHFKMRNPLNDFYGQPPLMAAAGRVDIDNFMRDFVKVYFNKAGVPGGLLSVKGKIAADTRKEITERFKDDYGGPSGWHKLLVVDQDASFTAMTSNLGASGLVIPELDKVSIRRICTVFGVPPTLLGIDDANTSYASIEMVQKYFWDNTLAPLYKDLAGALTLRLAPNFPGVEALSFDLSEVAALQEDIDQVHTRERSDLLAGGITIEEFRVNTGREPIVTEGTYLLPTTHTPVAAAMVADDSVDLSSVRVGGGSAA